MGRFAKNVKDEEIKRRMGECVKDDKSTREFALLLRELKFRERDWARNNRLKYRRKGDAKMADHFVGQEIALNRLLADLEDCIKMKKKIEAPHKKTKMRFLGLREAGLATYLCPACGRYMQFGHERAEGYCYGDRSEFK